MADNDLLETVESLLDSLDDVEEALEPLLLKSLQETLASADGPIERAKVLFWLAYTIHSCTWGMFMKLLISKMARLTRFRHAT